MEALEKIEAEVKQLSAADPRAEALPTRRRGFDHADFLPPIRHPPHE